jgi:SAM-dependent methyltransferase
VAADLWVKPSENWIRIIEANVASEVMPLQVEAHDLKFAQHYFDAIVSLDAYHYFGTDDLYLAYLIQFLRPEGQLGIAVPAVSEELDGKVPEHLSDQWDWDFHAFHSPGWWNKHWWKLGKVHVEHADLLPNGWRHWLRWEQLGAVIASDRWRERCAGWARHLEADGGRALGFTRVVARKPA